MTPNIDFYILENHNVADSTKFLCRLAEKAYLEKHQVLIYFSNEKECLALNDQLWTFRDNAFVPHQICQAESQAEDFKDIPILLASQHIPAFCQDILINWSSETLEEITQFKRVIEIIADDEEAKHQGRLRFASYREKGFELKTHKIANSKP